MTAAGPEKCPWSTLGVDRTASPKKIQEAYRKLAFKWHPDLNQGCPKSQKRFQEITAAFEKAKKEQEQASNRGRYTRPTSGSTTSSSYSGQRATHEPFKGFRHRGGSGAEFWSEYQGEGFRKRARRGGNVESIHAVRSRLRSLESLGTGIGVFGAVIIFGFSMLGTEYVWRVSNRGKSFEELMERRGVRDKR